MHSLLSPFEDVFLGLGRSGTIRSVLGTTETLLGVHGMALQGLTWDSFIQQYADAPARDGLRTGWLAITQRHVAPEYWPEHLPFKQGHAARVRPVEHDPAVAFAVHLYACPEYQINTSIGTTTLEASERLARFSQHLFRGTDGPLTDLQVRTMQGIVSHAEGLHQLLEDIRAEIFTPSIEAPLPHRLPMLLGFSEREFWGRRIGTHRLRIRCELASELVYCHRDLRISVQRVLRTLLTGITAETSIVLLTPPADIETVVQVEIHYHSLEHELRVEERLEPLALSDPRRFQATTIIQCLVSAVQARLKAVNGQCWAEPMPSTNTTARIVLLLPRWR